MLTLFPAIVVADGRAVQLVEGKAGSHTTNGDPLEVALWWQSDGAEWIHLVDLDAAFGRGSNAALLAGVIAKLDVNVELSGGIHDDASLRRALATDCSRVILGTEALDDRAWCEQVIATHSHRIAVALDVRVVEGADGSVQHRLAARGSGHDGGDLWSALSWLDDATCARYIVTDVSKDGMLRGPNVELYRAATAATEAPVIASGGISSIGDLIVLAEVAETGANLDGAIVGAALHAGNFTLPQALEAMRRVDDVSRRPGP